MPGGAEKATEKPGDGAAEPLGWTVRKPSFRRQPEPAEVSEKAQAAPQAQAAAKELEAALETIATLKQLGRDLQKQRTALMSFAALLLTLLLSVLTMGTKKKGDDGDAPAAPSRGMQQRVVQLEAENTALRAAVAQLQAGGAAPAPPQLEQEAAAASPAAAAPVEERTGALTNLVPVLAYTYPVLQLLGVFRGH
eukprot:TRINITY_DN5856_c0_g2_i4.p3 TRINITY_DN5856_c0_g2~~TRINITY_DN5856_c0_g2_i4.p3  ORF type:complete len:194 (+),score=79.82 TRINITY_DN5856_c0_g2_i4:2161-2742(+)